jgi:predicted nucleic acid-binding protein
MPILIDTNIILDVLTEDPLWADWSDKAITKHQSKGLIVNSIIYSELCTGAESRAEVDEVIQSLNLSFEEIPRDALYLAAKAFLKYRRKRGTKISTLPDFFIGGHAEAIGVPIITRDTARYQSYFPNVTLICPSPFDGSTV